VQPRRFAGTCSLCSVLSMSGQAPNIRLDPTATKSSSGQLGEFREARAIERLRGVTGFAPDSAAAGPFARTRQTIVRLAQEALDKIEERPR